MKKIVILIILTVMYLNTLSQPNFGPAQLIFGHSGKNYSLIVIDLDNDGDNDIVSTKLGDNTLVWYQNIEGTGQFKEPVVISNKLVDPLSVCNADIDNNGLTDLITASWNDNKIAWYKNKGNGQFSDQIIISQTAYHATTVGSGDIDSDGDFDVIAYSEFENKFVWYENNDGKGDFSKERIISDTYGHYNKFSIIDIDKDGDNDILTTSNNRGDFICFKNIDSKGTFDKVYIQMDGDFDYFDYIDYQVIDLDKDNDMDILAIVDYHSEDKLIWLKNNSTIDTLKILEAGIDIQADMFCIEDIDDDRNFEIILGASALQNRYHVCDFDIETNKFTEPQTIIIQGTYYKKDYVDLSSIHINSIDSDNAFDFLVHIDGGDFFWINNIGTNDTVEHINYIHNNGVYQDDEILSDLDGDNDIDILFRYKSYGHIVWYENIYGRFYEKKINTTMGYLHNFFVFDIDNDGDNDIIASSNFDGLVIFRNDGKGIFTEELAIENRYIFDSDIYMTISDLNGDGLGDIIYINYDDENSLAWYKNNGDGSFTHLKIDKFNSLKYWRLVIADIDSDGDNDILANTSFSNEIIWFENIDGNGLFGEETILIDFIDFESRFSTSDMDNDKDLDIIVYSYRYNTISFYENLDKNVQFGPKTDLTDLSFNVSSIKIDDFDNDGDKDIVTDDISYGSIVWFMNNGMDHPFQLKKFSIGLSLDIESPRIEIADMDADGDIDLILGEDYSPYSGPYYLCWFENLNRSPIEENIMIYPNPTKDYMTILPPLDMEIDQLQVYDLSGKEIQIRKEFSKKPKIDISSIQQGIYILHIKSKSQIFNVKIYKQ